MADVLRAVLAGVIGALIVVLSLLIVGTLTGVGG